MSYLDQEVSTTPTTPALGFTRLYPRTVSGVARLCYKDDAGVEYILGATAGGVISLNTQTGAVTIVSGTSGTDFAVNTASGVITLNLPVASGTVTGKLSSTDWTTFNGKQNALGFTPEDVANKSTSGTLGVSDTLYPSQHAVKTYVDNAIGGLVTGVSSVSNADGTLTITPTTGAVIAKRPAITGDVAIPAGSNVSALSATGVTAGSYTNASITVDGAGRITVASSGVSSGVTSVSSSDGSISVSPTSGAVDIVLPASGASAGTYPILKATIDSAGRVTSATDNTILTIVNAIIFG